MARIQNKARAGLVLCALLFLHSLLVTPFWKGTATAFVPDGLTYEQRRVVYAFAGIPMDQIRARLDQLLPAEAPVAVDGTIAKDAFFLQRLTEALYPRNIDAKSPHVVAALPASAQLEAQATELARVGADHALYLQGPRPVGGGAIAPSESFELSWAAFAGCLLAAVGFGAGALLALRRRFPGLWPAEPLAAGPAALLAGAGVIGLLNAVSTWLQFPLPRAALATAGIALFFGLCALAIARRAHAELGASLRGFARAPENWVFAALLLVFLVREAVFPITMWDGRSIWFFHAKQIFLQGMFATRDLVHPDSQWSHPLYPLLFPGWLAHFSSLSGVFNERMASLGIPALLSGALALVWFFGRRGLGRWPGAALTFLAFFSVEKLAAGGYVDGFVSVFVLLQFLALLSPESAALGWLAALILSLLKQEGLVFAGLIGLAFTLSRRPRRLAPLLVFAPAVIHEAWAKRLGLHGVFHDIRWAEVFEDFWSRLGVIAETIPELLGKFPLLWEGLACLPATVALWFCLRGRAGRTAWLATALAGAMFAFACAVLLITPLDLKWHVYTSLDRLMLHPAILLIAAPFLALTGDGSGIPGSESGRPSTTDPHRG